MELVDEGLELLDEEECLRLLASRRFGRVGVTIGALPAIFPVNHAVVDGEIFFRTGAGTKLSAALRHAVVVFEVDQVDEDTRAGWSVQAVGVAEEVTDPGLLSSVVVAAWAPGTRDHLIRIRPEMVTGRRIAGPKLAERHDGRL